MNTQGRRRVAMVCPRKQTSENDEPVMLTRELLQSYFDRSLSQVSAEIGICPTAIKRACRKLGIAKWPYKTPNPGPKKRKTSDASDHQAECPSTWDQCICTQQSMQAFPSLPLAKDPFEEERNLCFEQIRTTTSCYYEDLDLEQCLLMETDIAFHWNDTEFF
ncbi:hypothetical protein GUITHDRAFT_150294 [Guillardia theta CCMP2712]|uniref:RWP-RK domain-containing protein n=1 Tax=Guillardia theta (strain CCMP2712) TaxID=905079 RepID=L1JZT1_GUITC|nr:hypothetical protein GUITHDRAFT_150294 [Guillardia theta CCMP2712]EKX53784.1 hypothetical protein GUITHDRAFT_150294 [Guillardia theta CCMP2712]|eukprot:XP_005840764.1 hypothetical protein GUITHDRAFT_150294 [Guillardia theta CCMP2712]